MLKKISLLLFIAGAFGLAACGTATVNRNDITTTPTTTESASPPATTTASTGEKIGVPECDDFIAAYDACITDKVPEMARAQYKAGIEQWRTSWRKLAGNPETKASLAAACKQSAEQTRVAMKSYGCTF
jgi:hypothetical protein